jgi:hypothetical protein
MPCVTISGQFADRKDNGMGEHSGFIGVDIDDVDPEHVKDILAGNPYVFAMFTSISGKGVCVIFRIAGKAQRGICRYIVNTYLMTIKLLLTLPVNPSRARFVSL